MKAYSVDLRQRVADAVLQDRLPWAQVARLFRLSIASVGRFVLARRRGQDLSPRHSSGRPRRFDSPEKLEALRVQLRAEPDLSLVERCERLRQEQGLQVSEATLSRVLRRVLGWSHKKNQPASQRTRRSRTGRLAGPGRQGVQSRVAGLESMRVGVT
jgi:transposase